MNADYVALFVGIRLYGGLQTIVKQLLETKRLLTRDTARGAGCSQQHTAKHHGGEAARYVQLGSAVPALVDPRRVAWTKLAACGQAYASH